MNDDLPSMPYPEHDSILGFKSPSYSAEQMREYAKQAVEAFSDKCIDLVAVYGGPAGLEAAIRAKSQS